MEIEVNGTRLSFGVEGAAPVPGRGRCGSARWLVLDHGGPGTNDHSDLKPDFARLFGACQVIYLDLRGHGRSIGVRAAAWSFEDARTTSARSATRSGQPGQSSSGTRWRTGRAALRRAAWPLGALGGDPRCAALRRDGDRFGAGSHGPSQNLDGISSGTFTPALSTPAPTPSRRPMR
jgi:pimeloyl-ACP methyl ester carboxylesterase